tara:strand:+ start:280 stop:1290 length:1011 start_codon:yes stop_codon:yes gene_type:complete
MKIIFITANSDKNIGSYRIWVKDLSRTLLEIGHDASVVSVGDISGEMDCDVVILGKSAYSHASEVRKIFKRSKIGAINVARDYYNSDIDFVIVGSPEEYISMSKYRNVFIYPLIERKFEKITTKEHKDSDIMKFCFHGHWPHLAKFLPSLSVAIDRYHDEVKNSELHLITGEDRCLVHENKLPQRAKIVYHNYRKVDFTSIVSSMDVGLVPNVTSLEMFVPGISNTEITELGIYKTDFNIRFKSKTNAGRAYVFYQHGIPVIHDLSPSNFDFMGRTGIYVCAHDTESYFREMNRLTDPSFRNSIANINKKVFERDFSPLDHGKKLVDFINREILYE